MRACFVLFLIFLLSNVNAQEWDLPKYNNDWDIGNTSNKNKKNILIISQASLYTTALVGLNELWYVNYPRSEFHFINDNNEWLQMDKVGHAMSSYYIGYLGIRAYEWAGFNRKQAVWYGGVSGSLFLTIIEYLDGRSEEWGASPGDLIANTFGSLLVVSQALKWDEQKIKMKYSYSPSKWAKYNPSQLGNTHLERTLKDYNGQTYWLTFNLKSLFGIEDQDFPSWLNFAVGYSANAMVSPYSFEEDPFSRNRQYLASIDVDLNKIKSKSKLLNSIIQTFGFLKLPAPALEYREGNFYFHPIYF